MNEFFKIRENKEFEFFDPPNNKTISIRNITRHLLSLPSTKTTIATPNQLFLILGRLRALAFSISSFNQCLKNDSLEFKYYWMPRLINQLSGYGFSLMDPKSAIEVDGLIPLIKQIESIFDTDFSFARDLISNGKIIFDALGQLYKPGDLVQGKLALGTMGVFRVVECYFDEKRSLLGIEKSFHLSLEFIASMGQHLAVIGVTETLSGWTGVRTRNITDLMYSPIAVGDIESYIERGKRYIQFAVGKVPMFVAYSGGSFFMHGRGSKSSGSLGSGRIMIDVVRGASLGHHASQGSDEPTVALTHMAAIYKRWSQSQSTSQTDGLMLWEDLPNADWAVLCWPALVGFSFSAKCWGHVLVSGLDKIAFREDAFDRLVLAPERKQLIRALVRFGGTDTGDDGDIIGGKSGGSVFLLHGPPGVGKTLTAEAIAEVLKRPLYYVSMGELGTTPAEMEQSLSSILETCAGWNALVLLDEADVFLETRSTADLTRNAMVCVMLRLLEYHPGILFLTTNRVKSFDPAFESRVTVALRYEPLDIEARTKVWKNLLTRVNVGPDVSFNKLASKYELNGRQIKNAVRLAVSLSREKNAEHITQDVLETTLQITSLGRQDMKEDNSWKENSK
jgi:hypothetical protein